MSAFILLAREMRLLADQNIPCIVVDELRKSHDVAWIQEDMPGVDDNAVLRRAQDEERILLTFDKDFGELAFKYKLPCACGIILLRLPASSPHDLVRELVSLLGRRDDWAGHFSVVQQTHIRMLSLR